MNLSSILVFTSPNHLLTLRASLCALPGIEVHYQCPESGRLVVIQEAADDEAEMAGLQRIKALAEVAAAEMVYHYVHNDVDKDSDKASAHNNSQGDQGGELSWA